MRFLLLLFSFDRVWRTLIAEMNTKIANVAIAWLGHTVKRDVKSILIHTFVYLESEKEKWRTIFRIVEEEAACDILLKLVDAMFT
jgi:hypothetical protein